MTAGVSILIPAYAAEPFIDRTLLFARGQTHKDLSILVSVDKCEDQTHARGQRHADEDPRVRVFAQPSRLGWAGNVNFLLERVTTPFFFIYFHDDIILPQYTEKLLERLRANPRAISAHCDMGHFGGSERLSQGRTYDGDTAHRLMVFMLSPHRGSPLRSLMRSQAVPQLRLDDGASGGLWANETFLMEMLAAGPAVSLAEMLYLRWDKRSGGLTDTWYGLSPEQTLEGHRANLSKACQIIRRVAANDDQAQALYFALYLYVLPTVQQLERQAGRKLFAQPRELCLAFEELAPPASLVSFGPEIALWAQDRWTKAQRDPRTGSGAHRRGV
jgi:hypothetical protein